MDQVRARFDSIERFYGVGMLEKLSNIHIGVIGIGGVGSWTVEALARTGVGKLTLVDLDDICVSNTNRQVHAIEENFGELKVSAMKKRVAQINPKCEVTILPEFYQPSFSKELFKNKFDVIIDAFDSVEMKCHLISECLKNDIKIISVGAAGGKNRVQDIRTDWLENSFNDSLLQATRKKLRKKYEFALKPSPWGVYCVYSKQKAKAAIHFKNSSHPGGINCQNGWGSLCFLTGSLGFAAAQLAIDISLSEI
jgi:tRNA A37 threonylcarbamoyladenosine dehydratase